MAAERVDPGVQSRVRDTSAGPQATLNPTRRERKRESDRLSQQATRARTKAYIAHLEKTTATLTEIHGTNGALVSRQLKEQFDEIAGLKDVISQIAKLANGVAGCSSAGSDTDIKDQLPKALTNTSRQEIMCESPVPGAFAVPDGGFPSSTFCSTLHPNQESLNHIYPSLSLTCGNQDRDYFEALNKALVTMERNVTRHLFSGPEVDDDINIRAILHGWDAARAQNPFDIGWQLLQRLDEGLFFRSGRVERMAILRIIRSMLMVKVNPHLPLERKPPSYMNPSSLQAQVEHSRLIDYFVWPEVRDYLIMSGISYAPESLATQFATDIGLIWSFDLRDTCNHQPSKGTYSFSKEFNETYENLDSWYFKSPVMSTYLPPLSPDKSATGLEDDSSNFVPQFWNPPFDGNQRAPVWDVSWAEMMLTDKRNS